MKHPFWKTLSVIAIGASLAACGGSDDSSSSTTGTLSLGLTDAPVDSLKSVFITFNGVSMKPADGEAIVFEFDEPKTLDLLTLQGGNAAALLDDATVQAGAYEWVRLDVSELDGDLYVIDDNEGQHPLTIPSVAQTGLKLVSGFTVPAGGSADFTIDFDVRKSIVDPGGFAGYKLKPALRLIDNVQAGNIGGTVDGALLAAQCANSQTYAGLVYVFEGTDIVPNDFDGTDPEALMAVPAADGDTDGIFTYKAAFLSEGEYTVAYTCSVDEMGANDELTFVGTTSVSVLANEDTTVNFESNAE
ncbi:DUF4382 domain-containing protein [Hydrocarboniclastica marina]|uniref:DUF4382 domain-containing protein n=1 Tax=Hydrocarboniclastica marina TaxID=2259620 RepID=A0A4P7XL31_9ALTE|nr:DUF4382 domain-containing protein [Hydrocarboniclastica marina]QCF27224.1 DUF4382 domain-containing protein [Hydrocarboniclastica marina]